jgi:V/A-type H+-transporting ATPase subunit I
MELEMIPLEIVGLKNELWAGVHALQGLGCVQIDDLDHLPGDPARPLTVDSETLRTQEELKSLAAQVEGLLDALGGKQSAATVYRPVDPLAEARTGVTELAPKAQSLISRCEELQAELDALPRYEVTLRKLLPIIPPSAYEPGNVCIGVLVSRAHVEVLDLIGKHVFEQTGGRAEVMIGDVDESTRAMLLVFPSGFTSEIEALLGREDVSRLRLPPELNQDRPEVALAALHRRMLVIPEEIEGIGRELAGLAAQWCGKLAVWRAVLRNELELIDVLSRFGETDMTFVLRGWVPAKDVAQVESTLKETVGETALIRQLQLTPELRKRAPVVLQNRRPAQSFESLVRLLSQPRYGDVDPTRLMAFFMPIFFGMMLGDVGYGALLLELTLGMLHRFKTGILHDILIVLALGSGWSILFGFLFGEAFGTLGEHLGMHPIWFDRAGPEHVGGLLLMTLAVGAVHIVLGLFLGVWEAVKGRSRSQLLERGGMFVGLMGLFLLIGVLTDFLPKGFMTPAIGGLVVGIVLLSVPMGWVGILMGPVEFIGLIGNVLSYLRIAAIGLASVYLAQVANEMAGAIGNVIVGVIVAILIHTLNLVMGAFSPTIHSLRLHYVEFFRKFYQGGGRAYEPFGGGLSSNVDFQGTR